jgi:type IV pilus assembly protein PilA
MADPNRRVPGESHGVGSPTLGVRAPGESGGIPGPSPRGPGEAAVRSRREAAFSLIELLIVVTILGILASIAVPQFLAARRLAEERAVVANLRTMVSDQQLFFLSPVPLPPSATGDPGRRFARLHELNSFANDRFGATVSILYIDSAHVRYSMVPLWPSTVSLRGRFVIQATEQRVPGGFIYEIDESGRVVKIR